MTDKFWRLPAKQKCRRKKKEKAAPLASHLPPLIFGGGQKFTRSQGQQMITVNIAPAASSRQQPAMPNDTVNKSQRGVAKGGAGESKK